MEHNWKHTSTNPHNGEHWYECTLCGKRDWIAGYGTFDQLDGGRECPGGLETYGEVVSERNLLRNQVERLKMEVERLNWILKEQD